jgi:hypothetical protein
MYLDVKVSLPNKFWARYLEVGHPEANACAYFAE